MDGLTSTAILWTVSQVFTAAMPQYRVTAVEPYQYISDPSIHGVAVTVNANGGRDCYGGAISERLRLYLPYPISDEYECTAVAGDSIGVWLSQDVADKVWGGCRTGPLVWLDRDGLVRPVSSDSREWKFILRRKPGLANATKPEEAIKRLKQWDGVRLVYRLGKGRP